jgi:hypothetical protein
MKGIIQDVIDVELALVLKFKLIYFIFFQQNRLGLAHTFISVGPPSQPEQPSEIEIVNITNTSASISWIPGFDGGSEQLFELIYQDLDENQLYTLNTSLSVS